MVYFDGIHLMADSVDELHTAAQRCGAARAWFQDHPRHPHYDLWGRPAKVAIADTQIIQCPTRQLLRRRPRRLGGESDEQAAET